LLSLDAAARLEHIDQIKQLKARYFRLMDTKQWDEYRQVFTDDMVFFFESDEASTTSADEFVAHVKSRLATAVSAHHGHMPEIELTSNTTAIGIWAMYDWVDDPDHGRAFIGYGHYHEQYKRGADGRWRISELRLTRLRVDEATPSHGEVLRATPSPR
jgi:hypothetical protein